MADTFVFISRKVSGFVTIPAIVGYLHLLLKTGIKNRIPP